MPTVYRVDEARLWLDEGGGITLHAVTDTGDPVELSSGQARELAQYLLALADEDDR